MAGVSLPYGESEAPDCRIGSTQPDVTNQGIGSVEGQDFHPGMERIELFAPRFRPTGRRKFFLWGRNEKGPEQPPGATGTVQPGVSPGIQTTKPGMDAHSRHGRIFESQITGEGFRNLGH